MFDPVSCTSRLTHHFQWQHLAWSDSTLRLNSSFSSPNFAATSRLEHCKWLQHKNMKYFIKYHNKVWWDIRVWVWVSFWVTWIQHQLNTVSLSYYLVWFPLTHWSSIAVFDVHRIWIWVSYVEFDPSAVLRGDAVVFALVHVCHASGLRGSSFMTLRLCESTYYKSIQNQAALCSTIKSSAKNQTKYCPNHFIYYTSDMFPTTFLWDVCLFVDGTKIGVSCKGVLHHLSCLWDIVFEGMAQVPWTVPGTVVRSITPGENVSMFCHMFHNSSFASVHTISSNSLSLHGFHRSKVAAKRWPKQKSLQSMSTQETPEDRIVACLIVVWSGTTTSTSFTCVRFHPFLDGFRSSSHVTCDMPLPCLHQLAQMPLRLWASLLSLLLWLWLASVSWL